MKWQTLLKRNVKRAARNMASFAVPVALYFCSVPVETFICLDPFLKLRQPKNVTIGQFKNVGLLTIMSHSVYCELLSVMALVTGMDFVLIICLSITALWYYH